MPGFKCGERRVLMLTCLTLSFFLSSCLTVPSVPERLKKADNIAEGMNFKRLLYRTEPFLLTIYEKFQSPGQPLHVYIEGDGYAWVTRNRISTDPTPLNPVALELAVKDLAPNVVYIARPCQYTAKEIDDACGDVYWSEKRFSEDVVNSMDEAVTWYKKKAQSPSVDLIGYSGGGAVAVLIAARRQDVKSLRTIAGNLDPKGLNEYYGVSPLDKDSLDPMEVAGKVATIPQYHFVGAKDKVIPSLISENFSKKSIASACVHIMTVNDADHVNGWAKNWPQLLEVPFSCSESSPSHTGAK